MSLQNLKARIASYNAQMNALSTTIASYNNAMNLVATRSGALPCASANAYSNLPDLEDLSTEQTWIPRSVNNDLTAKLSSSLMEQPKAFYRDLSSKGWRFVVVDQQRGRCYYKSKVITVPSWAFERGDAYLNWYASHEMAHAYCPGDVHGMIFMEKLKEICPSECVHYELGYKPQNAAKAGIVAPSASSVPAPAIPSSFLESLRQKAQQTLATDALADDSVASLPEDYFDPDDSSDAVAYEDEIINESADSAANKAESFSLSITLNEKQLLAKETALAGKSFCLIGAAGTGKTTTQRSVAETLLEDKRLSTTYFKHPSGGSYGRVAAPSIAFCAYTRRATSNLRRAIHKNPALEETLKNNVLTIHQLLEYEPETYYDYAENKEKFRFSPKRTAKSPLSITHLVIEEASMIGIDLWEKLYDALPAGVQIIFIGDINQLPPVFGPSILNYALVQLPVVELTEVYRNQGIVLENAHNILSGCPLIHSENYQLIEGKNSFGQEKQSMALGNFFKAAFAAGQYDPERHMILTPWNKNFLGSDNMNKHISQFLGAARNAIVHEVIAGFNKLYLAEGDKVMVNKMDGVITKIEVNPSYMGKAAQMPGTDLTRFGFRIVGASNGATESLDDLVADYENFNLESIENEKMERKLQASHKITVRYNDTEMAETLSAVGDFGPQTFSLGYVLTVHKSQGSEWDKVFIIFHKEHAISLYRELFYTAATRARTDVCIIAKKEVVEKAIKTQRIKGNSLKDKLEYFNSGVTTVQTVYCTK